MTEQALIFLEEKRFNELKAVLETLQPIDIAEFLYELPLEKQVLVFRILPKELAAETFVEMDSDSCEYIIKAFSDKELREILDELFLDDMVDIIEEMPANVVHRILSNSDSNVRAEINQLLQYPKDSAGSIMTTEFVSLKENMTVNEAFERIRKVGQDKETIYTCYVTDSTRKLCGLVSVKTLLLSETNVLIKDLMEQYMVSAKTTDDKEEVAVLFEKYGFLSIPVTDHEDRLVGIVTVDDAILVIKEEDTEDIEVMAAITPSDKPYMKTSVFETWKKRIPWLLLLMISATFTGKIISFFEESLASQVILTAFIPMLMDTGGNAGGQTSVTIIRGLSLGEIEIKDLFSIVWKEFRVAFLCGLTLSVVNFAKLLWIDQVGLLVAAVVCITLFATVLIAKIVGCSLPVLAKKVGCDPAVMASPFITTIVDALSLLVYFNIASLLLGI
ncbi:MAG: magnesium transporter [Clostridia bacterium]|nr:magnesium transporter [Clostridia bacterium]